MRRVLALLGFWRARPDLTDCATERHHAERQHAEQQQRLDDVLPSLLEAARRNHFSARIAAAYREEPRRS